MLVRYFAIIKQIKQLNTTHSKFETHKERSDSGLKKDNVSVVVPLLKAYLLQLRIENSQHLL